MARNKMAHLCETINYNDQHRVIHVTHCRLIMKSTEMEAQGKKWIKGG